ncbi:MAG: type 4a pilus biogenesis protein PilO [Candidatus Omnitrophica bacterium]|nr:type 4a pilus biogenesis protein PilO [Candidatus Omnitrophota bacterium]
MSMTDREKHLALATLLVAIIGVSFMAWKVLSNQITDASVSEATAERFEDLFVKIKNVETQKGRNQLLRKKLGSDNGEFIGEDEVLALVAELEQVAGSSGVQIKNWDPSINKRAKPLAQLDLKISLECQFGQFIQFLNAIRGAKYICQPTALRVKLKDQKQPNLEVSLTLSTYLLNAAPEPVSPSLAQR